MDSPRDNLAHDAVISQERRRASAASLAMFCGRAAHGPPVGFCRAMLRFCPITRAREAALAGLAEGVGGGVELVAPEVVRATRGREEAPSSGQNIDRPGTGIAMAAFLGTAALTTLRASARWRRPFGS